MGETWLLSIVPSVTQVVTISSMPKWPEMHTEYLPNFCGGGTVVRNLKFGAKWVFYFFIFFFILKSFHQCSGAKIKKKAKNFFLKGSYFLLLNFNFSNNKSAKNLHFYKLKYSKSCWKLIFQPIFQKVIVF
jgi:hypothetical protein